MDIIAEKHHQDIYDFLQALLNEYNKPENRADCSEVASLIFKIMAHMPMLASNVMNVIHNVTNLETKRSVHMVIFYKLLTLDCI